MKTIEMQYKKIRTSNIHSPATLLNPETIGQLYGANISDNRYIRCFVPYIKGFG
ncbi:hypothetical protein D3C78_1674710 [compost metagenome]